MRSDFFEDFDKYYIGIQTVDEKKHCIRGWYIDQRFDHELCPQNYYMYEFREDDNDEWGYIACIEPFVYVNHSGTFVTKTKIPFSENGNHIISRLDTVIFINYDSILKEITLFSKESLKCYL